MATAVDRLGHGGVLLPTSRRCEGSWVTAAGLAAATERLKRWTRSGNGAWRRRAAAGAIG